MLIQATKFCKQILKCIKHGGELALDAPQGHSRTTSTCGRIPPIQGVTSIEPDDSRDEIE